MTFGGLGTSSPTPPAPVPRTIRQAVTSLLLTDSAIVAMVGERVYPVGLPQDCPKPALTIVKAGGAEPRTLQRSTAYRSARIRVSCWAESESEAEDLVAAVRARLVDYRWTVGTVRISHLACDNEIDMGQNPAAGTDSYTYQIVLDLLAWHRTS